MITELSRAQWGAGPLRSGHVIDRSQFVGLVVHHTVIVMPDYDHDSMIAGDLDDAIVYMRQLQHARPDLGDEVPYSFGVFEGEHEDDCIVAEGRGLGVTGAHTIGYNSTRYGVAFCGDFTSRAPTRGMWLGVGHVGRLLVDPVYAARTIEHRDVYATQCPGDATETPAPDVAQPPFPLQQQPEPVPSNPEDVMDWMYVRRDNPGQLNPVFAVLDSGEVFTVLTFAAFEGQRRLFGAHDRTPSVGFVKPVTDGNGETRNVVLTDEVGAEYVYRLP